MTRVGGSHLGVTAPRVTVQTVGHAGAPGRRKARLVVSVGAVATVGARAGDRRQPRARIGHGTPAGRRFFGSLLLRTASALAVIVGGHSGRVNRHRRGVYGTTVSAP
jgi:photosystem II stability/assembly factor-like uncharacterized protein